MFNPLDIDASDTAEKLREIIERVEREQQEIAERERNKSDIYQEAKSIGFDIKVIKAIIRDRKTGDGRHLERAALYEKYLAVIGQAPHNQQRTRRASGFTRPSDEFNRRI